MTRRASTLNVLRNWYSCWFEKPFIWFSTKDVIQWLKTCCGMLCCGSRQLSSKNKNVLPPSVQGISVPSHCLYIYIYMHYFFNNLINLGKKNVTDPLSSQITSASSPGKYPFSCVPFVYCLACLNIGKIHVNLFCHASIVHTVLISLAWTTLSVSGVSAWAFAMSYSRVFLLTLPRP